MYEEIKEEIIERVQKLVDEKGNTEKEIAKLEKVKKKMKNEHWEIQQIKDQIDAASNSFKGFSGDFFGMLRLKQRDTENIEEEEKGIKERFATRLEEEKKEILDSIEKQKQLVEDNRDIGREESSFDTYKEQLNTYFKLQNLQKTIQESEFTYEGIDNVLKKLSKEEAKTIIEEMKPYNEKVFRETWERREQRRKQQNEEQASNPNTESKGNQGEPQPESESRRNQFANRLGVNNDHNRIEENAMKKMSEGEIESPEGKKREGEVPDSH